MSVQQKRVKITILLMSLFIYAFAQPVGFVQADNEKGKLQFQVDRIGENDRKRDNRETELEKAFPTLFEDNITTKIKTQQQIFEMEEELLVQKLFQIEKNEDPLISEVKDQLFTDEYKATKVSAEVEAESEKTENKGILNIGIWLFGALLVSVLTYVLLRYMRKLS